MDQMTNAQWDAILETIAKRIESEAITPEDAAGSSGRQKHPNKIGSPKPTKHGEPKPQPEAVRILPSKPPPFYHKRQKKINYQNGGNYNENRQDLRKL